MSDPIDTIYAKKNDGNDPKIYVRVNGRINAKGIDADRSGVLELTNYDSTTTNFIFTDGVTGDLVFQTSLTSSKNFFFDRGNVGIGTNDPQNKLHVNGNVSATNNFITSSGYCFCDVQDTPMRVFSHGGPTILGDTFNVGIGTDTPSQKLHVYGNVYATGFIQAAKDLLADYVKVTNYLLTWGGICYCPSETTPMQVYSHGGNTILGGSFNVQINTRLGIGTSTPGYPLDVRGQISGTSGYYIPYYMWRNDRTYIEGPFTSAGNYELVSIKSEYAVSADRYVVVSDERIKENIQEVPDDLSLQKLRDIQCKYYQYKDKLSKGTSNTIGFIAQQVKEHMPMAVSIGKGLIPNEMRNIESPQWTEINDGSDNKFKLTISDLEDVSGNTKYKFYVSNDISGNDESQKDINSLEDEPNSFIFDQSWNNVFLYGKEVDNFHTLDKQKLFALNFSATQEIDRIQQQQLLDISGNSLAIDINKNELELLKLENQELTNKITSLDTELNNLKTIVESLVNNN